MSSLFIIIFGLAGFSFGWFVYSKFIAERIYRLPLDLSLIEIRLLNDTLLQEYFADLIQLRA